MISSKPKIAKDQEGVEVVAKVSCYNDNNDGDVVVVVVVVVVVGPHR